MPKGGKREGSGRKPKPLHQKIAEGNLGGRALKKVDFAERHEHCKTPPDYLGFLQQPIPNAPSPIEIYHETIRYLEPSECLHLIPTALISDYVMAKYYLIVAQFDLSGMVIVGKVGENLYKITDFTEAMLKLQKNVLACWSPIWDIVSRNSMQSIDNPEDDIFLTLFTGKKRKTSKSQNAPKTLKTPKGGTANAPT